MKAILPKIPKFARTTEALKKGRERVAKEIIADLEKTVATWEHKPRFSATIYPRAGGWVLQFSVSDQVWKWVDEGTKPHIIRPKGPWPLAFPSAFGPKTKPRVFSSGPGFSGGPTVYAQEVHHPGTEPREFIKELRRMRSAWYIKIMEEALHQGIMDAQS